MQCDFESTIACSESYWHFKGIVYIKDCNHDISKYLKTLEISIANTNESESNEIFT